MKKVPGDQNGAQGRNYYRPEDLTNWSYNEDLSDPGQYPFTRGIYRNMYQTRLWTMRQYSGFGTARESNHRFQRLLSAGTTGLSVAFDLPTQIGIDSDSDWARGEVGRVGVAIDTLEDMEILFRGIPLAEVSTSMTINATAAVLLAMYLAIARKQGVDWRFLRGTVQNDILKEYIARGTYIYPLSPSLRLVTDLMDFCQREVPRWNAISISGYHIREAGSTAVQEIAFTLANGEEYLREAKKAGIDLESLGSQISFFFSCHNDFFEEIAKFRAARRLWAELVRERLGIRNEKAARLRFHTQTAGSTLTAQQPENNTVRVAYQALAAILGGTQSLHTNAWDEALALPSDDSATLALRTQQVLGYETGVPRIADPLGGSWLLEKKTLELVDEAEKIIHEVRKQGGMSRAIAGGYPQKEIQNSSWDYQQKVESGEIQVVGLNCFPETKSKAVPLQKMNPKAEDLQKSRLVEFRKSRNKEAVGIALRKLEKAAEGSDNLMPYIISAVESHATIGEISDTLRGVFGEYREGSIL